MRTLLALALLFTACRAPHDTTGGQVVTRLVSTCSYCAPKPTPVILMPDNTYYTKHGYDIPRTWRQFCITDSALYLRSAGRWIELDSAWVKTIQGWRKLPADSL